MMFITKHALRILIAIVVLSSFLGCDNFLEVKGEIDPLPENQLEKCTLDLYLASKDNYLVESIEIKTKFEESFIVSPFEPEYYMVIRCDNYIYKTKKYKLDNPDATIDIGKIKLTPIHK